MVSFPGLLSARLRTPLSTTGLVLGSAAFLASLTPSLIPRTGAVQGGAAGLAFAAGYGIGVLLSLSWEWLGLAQLAERHRLMARHGSWVVSAILVLGGLAKARAWQETIHRALGLPAVETARPILIAATALAVAFALLLISRLFRVLMDLYAWPLRLILPKRLSLLLAMSLAAWSFWAIGNGYLMAAVLRGLDSAYRQVDALAPSNDRMPLEPWKTGSPASLISWQGLGREGRARILSLPSDDDLARLAGSEWKPPLRVYVGLNSAKTPQTRAELALTELIRIGAFERKLLVIATPTGTGWVDPAAMAPLEILHRGDLATVSVQYSYLPSWLSLLTEPDYGHETARAVFRTVYQHWHSLPKATRPRLYLFGLSLGALNSDLASDIFDIVGDPYDGAFWVGPPFPSRTWNGVQETRTGGDPWLPQARNRRTFRFFTNSDRTQLTEPDWGPMRILYLQYPSDPIVFFDRQTWRRRPAWMSSRNAPDLSPDLRWIPGVTFLQLVVDMVTATSVPKGVGHVYAASDYMAGWIALTQPQGWTDEELKVLDGWTRSQKL